MIIKPAFAQEIKVPTLNTLYPSGQTSGASGVTVLISSLWRAMIILGGVALLIFLAWGGIQWIMAGGDKQKVENSRNRIMNAFIGLALLAASVAIVIFVQLIFGIDLLNPTFYGPGVPGVPQ